MQVWYLPCCTHSCFYTATSTATPASPWLPHAACVQGGTGENLGQVWCRKLGWCHQASCKGHGETSAMLLGAQQLLRHLPHSERRRAKALKEKKKNTLEAPGRGLLVSQKYSFSIPSRVFLLF